MRSQAEHDRQGVDAFTEDQCLKLTKYLRECNDLRGVALLSLLAQGYRYKEIVSARVSESRDEDGHFAEIIKARDLEPSIYIFKDLRAWIGFASLGSGDLLFSSKVSDEKPMSQVTLRNIVRNWLYVMGCEVDAESGALRPFRRKALAIRKNCI